MNKLCGSFLAFALLSCHSSDRKEEPSYQEALRSKVLAGCLLAERSATYTEALSPAAAQAAASDRTALGSAIPDGYPSPFLPHGLLKNHAVDPVLARQPTLDPERVALGAKLFQENRLSFSSTHGFSGTLSCSSCHQPDLTFTDGRSVSIGAEGDPTPRNAPTLFNVAYNSTLTWANPIFPILELQAEIPLFGNDPIEMGLRGRESEVLAELLAADPAYKDEFERTFAVDGGSADEAKPIDYKDLTAALAAYERTLINFNTKFDRFLTNRLKAGETYNAQETSGLELFYGLQPLASGQTLACAQCHAGFMLTDSSHYVREGRYIRHEAFHNTGLYNLDGTGRYPDRNTGFATAAQLTADPALMGQFRTPPLRFVGLTAPYGHDGTQQSLEEVIDDYAAGGRSALTPAGQNPYVDPLVKPGFTLTADEKAALVAFLRTLQD